MQKISLAVVMIGLTIAVCEGVSEAQTASDQEVVRVCADHMQEHWLKIGDDWFTRVVTPDSLSIKKNYFIQARALKPHVEASGVTAADTREGIDRRQFVSFTGLFRTTEQGAWSGWTDLRKSDGDVYNFVYNCELLHRENRWTVFAAGAVGHWADRVLVRPAATDLPQ